MSGVLGLVNLDDAPVSTDDLRRMSSLLERRGPDGTGAWVDGCAGLGHTLLATTPEAVFERLPFRHGLSGCVITADVRLDNRRELLSGLGLRDRSASIGDAEIILMAYLAWGEACVERFLGDFAFAIWDPRRQALFCARDHFGLRPFYYHHSERRFFVFASEPRAILVLEQVPYRINEGRIADFLVSELEGIDKTSTFFEEVYRLPPAHTLTVTPRGMRLWRYWMPEPVPELRLSSNDAYAEAFLDVFTEAVRCRLRSPGPVGSMLSGGMDSGSVVAVASRLLAEQSRGPLSTFSATAPDPNTCNETRAIYSALTMNGLDPCLIHYGQLDEFMPELEELTWNLAEPFEYYMTLPRVLYLAANRKGLKVMLDGVSGDTVFSEGGQLARLMRRGRLLSAYLEAVGQKRFWGSHGSVWWELLRSARSAYIPNAARNLRRMMGHRRLQRRAEARIRSSAINPAFACRVSLSQRLDALDRHRSPGVLRRFGLERIQTIDHPYLTVGRERYDRVAAAVGVEPRAPFLDRRLVMFCLSLPGEQRQNNGWPKFVLRQSMAGLLPDSVRWRLGKEHLGWFFTRAIFNRMQTRIQACINNNSDVLEPYVDLDTVREAYQSNFGEDDASRAEKVYEAAHLFAWLDHFARRRQSIS